MASFGIEFRACTSRSVRRLLASTAAVGLLLVGVLAGVASAPQAAGALTVGAPSWWSGTCDANNWDAKAKADGWKGEGAHALGASYLGVPVCGPRPASDGSPNVQWTRSGWGEYEWQCTELAFRFMAQIYGVKAYEANGNTVVSHYSTADGGGLVTVTNGTKGTPPKPGDVMSFSNGGAGHVAVVSSTDINSSGTGTVTLISQNDSTNGWRTLAITDWKVASFGNQVPSAWLHDPAGRGDPTDKSQPNPPPGPFLTWDAFVAQQLLDFTGSSGTSTSRATARADLSAGSLDPDNYVNVLMSAPWYAGNMAPVTRLYWAYFNRIPDASGLRYWTGRHREGTSTSAISANFAGSTEFQATYGSLSNTAFVQLAYKNVLGRDADPSGLAYWVAKLKAGATRGAVMEGFSDSSEYTAKLRSAAAVVEAYMGFVRRVPTLTELARGESETIEAQIAQLLASDAYASRLG